MTTSVTEWGLYDLNNGLLDVFPTEEDAEAARQEEIERGIRAAARNSPDEGLTAECFREGAEDFFLVKEIEEGE